MNHGKQIQWYPGHMVKTRREICEKLKLIDIVYIDELIGDKPRLLIMTKYDLCDKKETDKFIKYYEDLGYRVIPVDLVSRANVHKIIEYSEEVLRDANEKRKAKGLKPRNIRALILGAPNVGKSTLINRLVGKKSVGVGNKPGFTKSLSWIRIHKNIDLLDTPGILWPKLEDQEAAHILASFSSIKEEILNEDQIASFILKRLFELYPKSLEDRYGIYELDDDLIEVYDTIASRRGALTKGGVTDYERVSRIILQDFKNGYFGPITFDRLCKKE